MLSSDNPLILREGKRREVRCVVNSNAVPAPTITWYLGSTNITSIAGTDTTSITLMGNRADNAKTLQCRATNNNKPQKIASTVLNVECKFNDIPSEYYYRYKKTTLDLFKTSNVLKVDTNMIKRYKYYKKNKRKLYNILNFN